MIFIGALFACVVAYATWKRPTYGLFLVALALPAYVVRFAIGPIPTTLLEMAIAGFAITGGLMALHTRPLMLPPRRLLAVGTLWILVSGASLFWTPELRAGLGAWKAFVVEPVLVIFVAFALIPRPALYRTIAFGSGLSALFVSVVGLLQAGLDGFGVAPPYWDLFPARITSVYPQPNMLTLFIGPIVAALVPVMIREKRRLIRIGALLLVGLGWHVMTLAHSEGALFGLFLAIVATLFITKKTRVITGVVFAVGLLFMVGHAGIRARLLPVATLADWSGKVRVIQWKEAISFIRDHPFRGSGLGGYQTAIAPYHQADYIEIFPYPHNIFLNVMVELGIFGILIFLAVIVLSVSHLIRNRLHAGSLPLLMAWLALVAHGFFDIPYFKNDLSILFWFLALLSFTTPSQTRDR